MSETKTAVSSTPILGLLGVLFVGLRLGHVIAWPWWVVTLPFWVGLVGAGAIILVAAIIVGIVSILED